MTQFGIIFSDDVFFTNFFYEIFGQFKSELRITNFDMIEQNTQD